MKIVVLYKEGSGCDYHRLLLPYSNIQDADVQVLMVKGHGMLEPKILEDVDIVVYNRVCPFDLDILLDWRKKLKFTYKIVCDIDDYWILNPLHEYHSIWEKTNHKQNIIDHIRLSDAVHVTHERLANKVEELNPNVKVIPNGFPFDESQFIPSENIQSDRLQVLYQGGSSHFYDLKLIQRAVEKSKTLPIDFIIAGYKNDDSASEEFWTRVSNTFRQNPNVLFKHALPVTTYMNHVDISNIVLAPLETNLFTWGKSCLKIIEAGAKNRPIICSNTYPYSPFENVEGVILCTNTKQWLEAFKYYSSKDKFSSIVREGESLGRFVRENFNLHSINKKRVAHFNSLH